MGDEKERLLGMLWRVCALATLWVAVAGTVFALRHPWATQTERVLYTVEALTFQRVDRDDMRSGE